MTLIDLKSALPEERASEAKARGLLEPAALTAMLRDALRRDRVDAFFTGIDRLADGSPAMSDELIHAEIIAARSARR